MSLHSDLAPAWSTVPDPSQLAEIMGLFVATDWVEKTLAPQH